MPNREAVFCLAEDREEIGLKLAILSIDRYCPGAPIFVFRSNTTEEFGRWLNKFPQVSHISEKLPEVLEWDCKPYCMLYLLERGWSQVIWLDSDIVLTRDCRLLFAGLQWNQIALAQEPSSVPEQGTKVRTIGWGLSVGRTFPMTLNSSVIRVTETHMPLLHFWKNLLQDDRYTKWKKTPPEKIPVHVRGDQDILNAILGAKEFENIPVYVIPSGCEIIHCGGLLGYSLRERIRGLVHRKPTFLHAIGGKPWILLGPYGLKLRGAFFWYRRLLQEFSPYVAEVRRYRKAVGSPMSWLDVHTFFGLLSRIIGFGHFALRGLPLTLLATIVTKSIQRKNI